MDYFRAIRTLLVRADKLRTVGNERADRLAEECEKRAKHKFWDARHESYLKARRANRPAYRKKFTQ